MSIEPTLGAYWVRGFRRDRVTVGDDDLFADLLDAAQHGNPRAFEQLVEWLSGPLLGFATARGSDDPDGMVNEVLVRVFRGIAGFQGTQAMFRAWVYRIARNVLVDEHRRRAVRAVTVPNAPDMLDALDESPTVPDGLDHVGERERVDAMLAILTDEQREVLLLRVVAGLSVEEAAAATGRAPGAVRSLQHRALSRLRTALSRIA